MLLIVFTDGLSRVVTDLRTFPGNGFEASNSRARSFGPRTFATRQEVALLRQAAGIAWAARIILLALAPPLLARSAT
jgi:hypothetical protein